MTRLAQRNQITPIMCATFTQRLLVMNLFHRNCKSTFKTQFTERMLRSILITYSLPCTTITTFGLLGTATPPCIARALKNFFPKALLYLRDKLSSGCRACTSRHLKANVHPRKLSSLDAFRIITISYLWTLILSHQLPTFRNPSISFKALS